MRERTKKETKTQVSPKYWLGERVCIKEPEISLIIQSQVLGKWIII